MLQKTIMAYGTNSAFSNKFNCLATVLYWLHDTAWKIIDAEKRHPLHLLGFAVKR